MPAVKGVMCSLTIEGQDHPTQECGIVTREDFASAYVIAEANQRFHVNVSTTEFVHENLEVYVYIDGKYQNSSIWTGLQPEGSSLDEKYQGKRESDGNNTKVAFERPWRFDDLVVVDERGDDCEEEQDVLSNIGTIEVVILRCNEVPKKRRGYRRPEVAGSSSRSLNDDTITPHPDSKPYWKNWDIEEERVADPSDLKAIFEKDVKNIEITHRVVTEEEEMVKSIVCNADLRFLDSFEKPYCILVMKYRSRGMLQNMGYLPKSAISSRESSADLEELRALPKEDMLRELLRYKKLAESAKRVRTESDGEMESKQVKRESSRWANKEFVDLTGE